VPYPISAMAAVRSRAADGSAISERSGGGTVTIASSASNMAPSLQQMAIPPADSSMELTAVPIVYDVPIADVSACICERLELQE
jgi:hypothetical protein